MITITHNYKSLAYYLPDPHLVFGVERFGKKRVTLILIDPVTEEDGFTKAFLKSEGEKIYYSNKRCMTRKEFDKDYILRV